MDRLKQVEEFINHIPSHLLLFFISLFAGCVKFIIKGSYTYKNFLINITAASLSGLIVFLLCQYKGLDSNLTGAIVGASGYSGVELLKYMLKTVKNIVDYCRKDKLKEIINKLIN